MKKEAMNRLIAKSIELEDESNVPEGTSIQTQVIGASKRNGKERPEKTVRVLDYTDFDGMVLRLREDHIECKDKSDDEILAWIWDDYTALHRAHKSNDYVRKVEDYSWDSDEEEYEVEDLIFDSLYRKLTSSSATKEKVASAVNAALESGWAVMEEQLKALDATDDQIAAAKEKYIAANS